MKFSDDFLKQNMMGPNVVTLLEELTDGLRMLPDMRILDLGCGRGLSSIALADKSGAQVFAADLWIPAEENHKRFTELGFDKQIIPISADAAHGLPFAHEYFDAVVSIDAYHYFGRDEKFMDEKLAPYVKTGGLIAFVIPGMKQDIHNNIPECMLRSWTAEDLETIQTMEWWRALLEKSALISDLDIREMMSYEASWADWLASDNPYAVSDRAAMEAGAGQYMNMIAVVCKRK